MFTLRAAPRQNYTVGCSMLMTSTRQSSLSHHSRYPKEMRLAIVARRVIDCIDTSVGGISKAARHLGVRAVCSIGPQYLVRASCGRLSPQSRDTAKRAFRDQFVRGNCSYGGSRPRCITPARPGAAMAGGLVARQTAGTGPFLYQSH